VDATFTLQKEVAERVASPPGSRVYGALSVLTTVWADASIVLRLAPGAFHPRPGVDSAVLRLVFRERPRVEIADEAFFERVVFAAFAQRRKTILNSLRGAPGSPVAREAVPGVLAEAGIDPVRRAETVSVEEFGKLAAAAATAAGR
jgi:16S rRNA (adenine1518-N6/adenine1519-N6)-dimethyltransferase